jgi:hypothetical protein
MHTVAHLRTRDLQGFHAVDILSMAVLLSSWLNSAVSAIAIEFLQHEDNGAFKKVFKMGMSWT